MNKRSGYLKSNVISDTEYRSFMPSKLPPQPNVKLDSGCEKLLIEANKRLALLDGLSSRIPNMNMFISMYVRKEALMSSQIEGTQATLEDILNPLVEDNTNQNVAEVVNYIKSAEFAISRLKALPLCNRLICEAHAVLMEGVRGQEKTPGEFRRSQNWIGGQGSLLKNAIYIPPTPEDMQVAMFDLENYINNSDINCDLNVLIQTALIHYQFETIHPFLDGNGRIGRLLVILFLMEKQVLSAPILYISYALKRNRTEYYDRMMTVREKGDYEQWVKFFLSAILESADDAIFTIDSLAALHNKNTTLIQNTVRSTKTLNKVFSYIEKSPIIEIRKTASELGMSFNTISDAVKKLCELGILRQTNTAQRNRTFEYTAYLDILRSGT